MGYSLGRFIGPVDPNLVCSICSGVLEGAVLTPCGHSFCLVCLTTWLSRPVSPSTCPQCRGNIEPLPAPILSIRNLVNSMDIKCEYHSRGCRFIAKVELMKSHVEECDYIPIECAGCNQTVNRAALAEHHMSCDAIAAIIREDDDSTTPKTTISSFNIDSINSPIHSLSLTDKPRDVADLTCRVITLEMQLKHLKLDLDAAAIKNRKLEREIKETKEELEDKRSQLINVQFDDFDSNYDYGYTSASVVKLSRFISRYLMQKPSYVDERRVFSAIQRCCTRYGDDRSAQQHDVHMLLATAFATNWFSMSQRASIHCWLRALARQRLMAPVTTDYLSQSK